MAYLRVQSDPKEYTSSQPQRTCSDKAGVAARAAQMDMADSLTTIPFNEVIMPFHAVSKDRTWQSLLSWEPDRNKDNIFSR